MCVAVGGFEPCTSQTQGQNIWIQGHYHSLLPLDVQTHNNYVFEHKSLLKILNKTQFRGQFKLKYTLLTCFWDPNVLCRCGCLVEVACTNGGCLVSQAVQFAPNSLFASVSHPPL